MMHFSLPRLGYAAILAMITWPGCMSGDPYTGDPQPIDFSNLRVEEITHNRAVFRGDTSIPATCLVTYGLSMDDMPWEATDPEMMEGEYAIDHQVPLEDLMPATTYYLRGSAEGANGEAGVSDIVMFSTVVDPGNDPTADMVNVALLAEGTTVAAVSSNWNNGDNDSSYGIHNALDGQEATEWSTAGDGNGAWVELDLGQERTISHIAFRSRMMQDGTSIVLMMQLVLPDGQVIGPFATPDHTVRYVFELPEPIVTDTIRYEAVETTGGNTGAKEIQLFAAP